MPSERKVIAFRPDNEEEAIVIRLAKKHGLSMARVLGMALRQMAEQEQLRETQNLMGIGIGSGNISGVAIKDSVPARN